TPSYSCSPSASDSPSQSESPSRTHSVSPSETSTKTHSDSPSATISVSPSTSVSATPSLTVSPSFTRSPSVTVSPTQTWSGSPSETNSPTLSFSPTSSQSPTNSVTNSPTISATPTASVSPSATVTDTPSQQVTESSSLTPSSSGTPSETQSSSPSDTKTMTPTGSQTPTTSATPSWTQSVTPSQSSSPTLSASPSVPLTPSATNSLSNTSALTPTRGLTRTNSTSVSGTASSASHSGPTKSLTRTISFTTSKSPTTTLTDFSLSNTTFSKALSLSRTAEQSSSESASREVSSTWTTSLSPTKTSVSVTVSLPYYGEDPTHLTTTVIMIVFNGTRWPMVLAENRTAVITFLVSILSQSLGLPEERVQVVSLLIGSLIAILQIQRNASQVLPEAFISNTIAHLTDFDNITQLYRDVSGDLLGGVFGQVAASIDVLGVDIANTCNADCVLGIGLAVGIVILFTGMTTLLLYLTGHWSDHEDDHVEIIQKTVDNASHHPFGEDEVVFEKVFSDGYYSHEDDDATSSGLSSYDHWRGLPLDGAYTSHHPTSTRRERRLFHPFADDGIIDASSVGSSSNSNMKYYGNGPVDEPTVSAPYSPGGRSSWYSTSPCSSVSLDDIDVHQSGVHRSDYEASWGTSTGSDVPSVDEHAWRPPRAAYIN
ncbi:transmembrane protein, putative, partial [Bodo saltans]